jgi:hypothetical protein
VKELEKRLEKTGKEKEELEEELGKVLNIKINNLIYF